jgi:membrane protein
VVWEFAKSGFAIYAANIGRFDRYSGAGAADGSSVSLGDTFGLIIAFVFWVYFSGLLLMLGAIVVLLHEKGHRSRRAAAIAEASAEDLSEISHGGDALPEQALSPLVESPLGREGLEVSDVSANPSTTEPSAKQSHRHDKLSSPQSSEDTPPEEPTSEDVSVN